jgi:hypothetical protein
VGSDQLADVNQGIVFRLLSLLEAYLCAIEEEAPVTLRSLQTLPLLRDPKTCRESPPQLRLTPSLLQVGEPHEIHMGEWSDALVAICLCSLQSINQSSLFATHQDRALVL